MTGASYELSIITHIEGLEEKLRLLNPRLEENTDLIYFYERRIGSLQAVLTRLEQIRRENRDLSIFEKRWFDTLLHSNAMNEPASRRRNR